MRDSHRSGCNRFGAQMGRQSDLPLTYPGEVVIRDVPLDEGGYDPGGAYWGVGVALWLVEPTDPNDDRVAYCRAFSLTTAIASFPEAKYVTPIRVDSDDIAEMSEGYLQCALFTGTDEDETPLDDKFSTADFSEGDRAKARMVCEEFAANWDATLLYCIAQGRGTWERAGMDLWLSRNQHGISFADHWPEAEAKVLDEAADKLGEAYVYVSGRGHLTFD
jgi:hypothetical protein